MSSKDNLGDRMKEYEGVPKSRLVRRTPVIIRLDGKAFHTFTRGLQKPYDARFQGCMHSAAQYLCKQVQGCRLAYVQSDEISLLLVDYMTETSEGWFDYEVQKMVSVSASMVGLAFYAALQDGPWGALADDSMNKMRLAAAKALPAFDSRCFNLPKEEVVNYFIWRQQDATRNSISMAAQSMFSHKELHGVSCDGMQDMMHQQRGVNWNDYPTAQKRGVCVVKTADPNLIQNPSRPKWVVDYEIPIFTQDRNYVERLVAPVVTK